MHLRRLAAFLPALLLAAGTRIDAQSRFTLADVALLAGCWSGSTGTVELREQWSDAAGGTMLGTSRFFRDGEVVDWEFGRIVEDAEGVTLWPYPRGVISEHGFPLVRGGDQLVFENLEHDFPVRILYARASADSLLVRIEGADGRGQGWSVARAACTVGGP
jgi:hypothetical protein